MAKIIGIDLGTTNSCLAVVEAQSPKIIENAGGIILEGVCFYNMHAREIGEANGWKRLMSNSAKIINILGGYGYETILNSMEKCVISACQGKIVK